MGLRFRPGLFACFTGGTVVLLDVHANRYAALGQASSDALQRMTSGADPLPEDEARTATLVARGILCVDASYAIPEFCTAGAIASAPELPTRPIARSTVAAALARTAIAAVELRTRSLAATLSGISRAKERAHVGEARSHPCEIAAAFAVTARIVSIADRCLPRSLALARTLLANNHHAELVIGVKLRPFEAHCWIQSNGMLIGDDLGTTDKFSPILVV